MLETLLEAGRTPRDEREFELLEGRLTVSKGQCLMSRPAYIRGFLEAKVEAQGGGNYQRIPFTNGLTRSGRAELRDAGVSAELAKKWHR